MIELALLIAAFVLFIVAALNTTARFNVMAAGCACWVAALIVSRL